MNISVVPQGRTGNRLMQYALGLILAKNKNYSFFAERMPYFDNIKITEYVQNDLPTIRTSQFGNQYYDYNNLLSFNGNIIIDSYVQKVKLLLENRNFLQEQFKVANTINKLPDKDELVIHIRGTDYRNLGTYLGDEFYFDFIKKSDFNTKTIITDDVNSPLMSSLKDIGCNILTQHCTGWQVPYFTNNEINDYNYMLHAHNILISQSTFSWWAAFLGPSKQIFFPFSRERGMWPIIPKKDDIDLYFDIGTSKKILFI